jgi:hypothetical protein
MCPRSRFRKAVREVEHWTNLVCGGRDGMGILRQRADHGDFAQPDFLDG